MGICPISVLCWVVMCPYASLPCHSNPVNGFFEKTPKVLPTILPIPIDIVQSVHYAGGMAVQEARKRAFRGDCLLVRRRIYVTIHKEAGFLQSAA